MNSVPLQTSQDSMALFEEARRRMSLSREQQEEVQSETHRRFAFELAHEIKNPLASLRSAIEALELINNRQKQGQLMDVIKSDLSRLDRLVADMTGAGELEFDLRERTRTEVDICAIVSEVIKRIAKELPQVEFAPVLPDGPIMINGLPIRLAQLTENLVRNAASFSPLHGTVMIYVRRQRGICLLTVEDQGKGLAEHSEEKIFRRFYSLRPVDHFGLHSGLGLSICKQIVSALGGAIWAENNLAKDGRVRGARFHAALPSGPDSGP